MPAHGISRIFNKAAKKAWHMKTGAGWQQQPAVISMSSKPIFLAEGKPAWLSHVNGETQCILCRIGCNRNAVYSLRQPLIGDVFGGVYWYMKCVMTKPYDLSTNYILMVVVAKAA